MDANLRKNREEMKAGQELLKEEMLAKLDAHYERMMTRMDSQLEEMDACLEKEATDLEANPEEIESEAVHEDVPKNEAAGNTVRALKERYADWYLAVWRSREPKKRSQDDGGSLKKLVAARRGMACIAIPAPRKGHGGQGPGKDNVVRGTRKGRKFVKRRRANPKRNNDIRNRGL
jgi:hypothetical protein